MFDTLSEKLQRIFKNLKGEARISEQHLDETLKEIRIALLEADVNFKVVKQFTDVVKQKALGQEVMQSLNPGQQVVKVVHDELVEILGGENVRLNFASQPPTVIMMVGLQGSGKTTSTGKLARWLTRNNHRPMLVSVDVYRPAARPSARCCTRPARPASRKAACSRISISSTSAGATSTKADYARCATARNG